MRRLFDRLCAYLIARDLLTGKLFTGWELVGFAIAIVLVVILFLKFGL